MKKWLEYQLNNKHLTIPILSFPAVQIMNVNVSDIVSRTEYQARAIQTISERCPVSTVLSSMDLSVEAEAFGGEIRFSDMEIPTVTNTVISTYADIENLQVPPVGKARTGVYIDAIRMVKKSLTKPVFAGVIGPFSLAGRLMDMTEIMVNCYEEPDWVHKTLRKCSDFIKDYILAFKNSGADGVVIAEPAAGLLSPAICDEFSSSYIREIIKAVSDEKFIIVYHNCGNVVPLSETLLSLNADVYHFGNSIDIEDMLKLMPDKIIMGNLNPLIFKNGTFDSVKQNTLELLLRCGKYDNFVISSGCDIPPMSSWDNIFAYFDAVKKYYGKEE